MSAWLLRLRYALGRWLVAPVIRLPRQMMVAPIRTQLMVVPVRLQARGRGLPAASARPFNMLDESAAWALATQLMAAGEDAANAVDMAFAARSRLIALMERPPVAEGRQK